MDKLLPTFSPFSSTPLKRERERGCKLDTKMRWQKKDRVETKIALLHREQKCLKYLHTKLITKLTRFVQRT